MKLPFACIRPVTSLAWFIAVAFWLLLGRGSFCCHYCIIDLRLVVASQCTFIPEQTTGLIMLLHHLLALKRNCKRMSCVYLVVVL